MIPIRSLAASTSAMSTTAVDLLKSLQDNIAAATQSPSTTALDSRTFDQAELILPTDIQENDRVSLVQALVALLPTLQQDPTPAVNLLVRLIEPYTYSQLLALGGQELPWTDGLAVGDHMTGFNRLMLAVLDKATVRPSDAAHVASNIEAMLALVKLWLCTADTGIASQSSKLLIDLLRVDQEVIAHPDDKVPSGGQGLVWKRIFGDKNVYGAIYQATALSGPSSIKLSKSQRTLAQARLMEWIPIVGAMDWNAISRNQHDEVESAYGVEKGLLQFAAEIMVDFADDILMYRTLVDFYSDLLQKTKATNSSHPTPLDSPALRYLIERGLHARTAAIYLQPPGRPVDPLESMFLYGPAANYIATYASCFPDNFLASSIPKEVNARLRKALDLSSAKWSHAESPKHDLHLLASLPRTALLYDPWRDSPISLLPSLATNPDVLNTLATVFHGPARRITTFPVASPMMADEEDTTEASAARALYFHYLAQQPRLFQNLAMHGDTVALKEVALAAINCLTAIITANWSTTHEMKLPTNIATPDSGHLAIISPPALEHALPYLLKPPQTFSNLVGGRGDAESAAYKIAAAKFDAVRALHAKMAEEVERRPGEGFEEILTTLNKRLAEGPLSRTGEVGGRIATLDM